MKNNLLYLLAIVLLILWVLGAFIFTIGSIIHLLLLFAVVTILIKVIKSDKPRQKP